MRQPQQRREDARSPRAESRPLVVVVSTTPATRRGWEYGDR